MFCVALRSSGWLAIQLTPYKPFTLLRQKTTTGAYGLDFWESIKGLPEEMLREYRVLPLGSIGMKWV